MSLAWHSVGVALNTSLMSIESFVRDLVCNERDQHIPRAVTVQLLNSVQAKLKLLPIHGALITVEYPDTQ